MTSSWPGLGKGLLATLPASRCFPGIIRIRSARQSIRKPPGSGHTVEEVDKTQVPIWSRSAWENIIVSRETWARLMRRPERSELHPRLHRHRQVPIRSFIGPFEDLCHVNARRRPAYVPMQHAGAEQGQVFAWRANHQAIRPTTDLGGVPTSAINN